MAHVALVLTGHQLLHFSASMPFPKEGRAAVLSEVLPRLPTHPPAALRGLPGQLMSMLLRGLPGQPGLAPERHLGTAGRSRPAAATAVAPSRASVPLLDSTCDRSSREPWSTAGREGSGGRCSKRGRGLWRPALLVMQRSMQSACAACIYHG